MESFWLVLVEDTTNHKDWLEDTSFESSKNKDTESAFPVLSLELELPKNVLECINELSKAADVANRLGDILCTTDVIKEYSSPARALRPQCHGINEHGMAHDVSLTGGYGYDAFKGEDDDDNE